MGPRPDGRGRIDELGAEYVEVKRQWGRGRMAAEGWTWPALPQTAADASMGPRPDGRGRHGICLECETNDRRQWGRGRMAAEGHRHFRGCKAAARVNGAAAGWPRKALSRRPTSSQPPTRQWGRGRMAAEGSIGLRAGRVWGARQWGRGRMAAEGRYLCFSVVNWV